MFKKLKFRTALKGLACGILSVSMLAECTTSVWASAEDEDMPGLEEYLFNATGFCGSVDETEAEEKVIDPCKSYVHLTDEAFDVTDFGELDDIDKPIVFACFANDFKNISESILACSDLKTLKDVIEKKFFIKDMMPCVAAYRCKFGAGVCTEGTDFDVWYNRMQQLLQKDRNFLKDSDRDQLLDFRVLFLREIFLRAVYVSICSRFSSDNLARQRVYMVNKHLLTFAENNRGILSPDNVKSVYDKIGKLLLKDVERKDFSGSFLNLVDSKKYKRTHKICPEPGVVGQEMDFSLMDSFKSSKQILIDAYAKLKEADRLLSLRQYALAYVCVGESLELMEEFKSSYHNVLLYCASSRRIIDEYNFVFARWNKIKDTIDTQILICNKFDDCKSVMNNYINTFCVSVDGLDYDWFADIDMALIQLQFSQAEIDAMGYITQMLSELKENMLHNYDESLLSCARVQNILESIRLCVDNIARLKDRAEKQIEANAKKLADAERGRELKQARLERQELLRRKKEQEALRKLERIKQRTAQRRAASVGMRAECKQEYQITYINDKVKRSSQEFLCSGGGVEVFWKKWFNQVRVTGSSTMNYLPNMKSQRAAFLSVEPGLIKIAPGDVIYEARLDTSGEKTGMRIVYYIEKDTHKVVILYVGDPFGIIHKNVVNVSVRYANFPEASLGDCETSLDSESAGESSKVDGSKGSSDDDDSNGEKDGAARPSAPKKEQKKQKREKSKKKSRGHDGHKK